jgi:hypothetical protein
MQDGKTLRNVKARGMEKPVYKNIYLLTQEEACYWGLSSKPVSNGSTIAVACTKVREAGPLRTIKKGKAKVAEAPTEEDWQQAAVYQIKLPAERIYQKGNSLTTEVGNMLSVTYRGDCARLYAKGKLIADNFQYGRPFLYGLWRLPEGTTELELRILPWQQEAPIYLPREADKTPGEKLLKAEIQ